MKNILVCIVVFLLTLLWLPTQAVINVCASSSIEHSDTLNPIPNVVPSLREWTGREGQFTIVNDSRICVEPSYYEVLMPRATIFKKEIKLLNDMDLEIIQTDDVQANDFYFTLECDDQEIGNEGHMIDIGNSITIEGNDADGVFFGTRTLLQLLVQDVGNNNIPKGIIRDYPKYKMRGLMLDVARKFYTIDFLRDYVKLMSWFKMSDFHIHFSDNNGEYVAYRIESDIHGLTATDGYYTKQEIRDLVALANEYSINIIPEIDTPGHASPLLKVKPELKTKFNVQNLDLFNPNSLNFVKEVLAEVIPLFDGPYFHIGTDEYFMDVGTYTVEEKRQVGSAFSQYIEDLSNWVRDNYNKEVMMWTGWGNMTNTSDPDKNNIIDNWEAVDANSLIAKGYNFINSDYNHLYTVGNGSHRVNNSNLYENWNPRKIRNYTIPDNVNNLLGAKIHHWLDHYRDLMTEEDSDKLLQPSIKALSEKLWGGPLSEDYEGFVNRTTLVGNAPGTQLTPTPEIPKPDPDNLAYNKTVVASGNETADFPPEYAVDVWGDTRWSSATNDNQWIYVDLDQIYTINKVELNWETAYGSKYKIQVSQDAQDWVDVYVENAGDGEVDEINFADTSARYVKMQGIKRATQWGYSLYDLKVYGTSEETPVSSPTPIAPLPTQNQMAWQDMGMSAFIHFGVNTFTDKEWGDGTENPNVFNPGTEYDPEQWVREFRDAGFKQVILTAKHHDGFCLWPSAYTDHDVASSTWKDGQGDVVKDVSDACEKYDLKFGVYLSPWDRHEETFGTGSAYDDYYKGQLTELLENYGTISEVWWDGAGSQQQTYDYEGWTTLVRNKQPNAVIFGCFGFAPYADIHWIGNEHGYAGEPNWSMLNPEVIAVEDTQILPHGQLDGSKWIPGEADVSIRPGWFYHDSQDTQVKSLSKLADIYLSSIGHNAGLLINVPPDRRGLLHENDVLRLKEFKIWLDTTYSVNLADNAVVTATNTRGSDFTADKVLDDDRSTYWAAEDDVTSASLEIDLQSNKTFDLIEIQEPIQLGQRITEYNIEVWNGNTWNELQQKQSIGNNKLLHFSPISATKIRMNITKVRACPAIESIRIFKQGSLTGDDNTVSNENLALNKTVTVSNVHSQNYGGGNAVDGNAETRWATSDDINHCTLEVDFMGQVAFNKVVIKQFLERIGSYKIQYFNGLSWVDVYSGNNPSEVENITFETTTSNKIRLLIESVKGDLGPSIYELEVYNNEEEQTNIAIDKPVESSSVELPEFSRGYAVDGDTNSRWSSNYTDQEWIYVDLGMTYTIDKVILNWESAYGEGYKIQISNDGESFSDVYTETNGDGDVDIITFTPVSARYVKMQGTKRGSQYGYSLYEFMVYGK